MNSVVHLKRQGDIAVLVIDNPPVNAISKSVIQGMELAIEAFEADVSYLALVISCAGRTFVAGGDISAFDDPDFSAAPFNRLLARIELLDRIVIAALHGNVLGGGLELALACHYRVCAPGTQFGLPEVKLGLLPGSLGTQRLPRLVGIKLALDLISTGRSLDATAALAVRMVDEIRDEKPEAAGVDFAQRLVANHRVPRRISEHPASQEGLLSGFLDAAQAQANARASAYPAALAIVQAVRSSLLPFA